MKPVKKFLFGDGAEVYLPYAQARLGELNRMNGSFLSKNFIVENARISIEKSSVIDKIIINVEGGGWYQAKGLFVQTDVTEAEFQLDLRQGGKLTTINKKVAAPNYLVGIETDGTQQFNDTLRTFVSLFHAGNGDLLIVVLASGSPSQGGVIKGHGKWGSPEVLGTPQMPHTTLSYFTGAQSVTGSRIVKAQPAPWALVTVSDAVQADGSMLKVLNVGASVSGVGRTLIRTNYADGTPVDQTTIASNSDGGTTTGYIFQLNPQVFAHARLLGGNILVNFFDLSPTGSVSTASIPRVANQSWHICGKANSETVFLFVSGYTDAMSVTHPSVVYKVNASGAFATMNIIRPDPMSILSGGVFFYPIGEGAFACLLITYASPTDPFPSMFYQVSLDDGATWGRYGQISATASSGNMMINWVYIKKALDAAGKCEIYLSVVDGLLKEVFSGHLYPADAVNRLYKTTDGFQTVQYVKEISTVDFVPGASINAPTDYGFTPKADIQLFGPPVFAGRNAPIGDPAFPWIYNDSIAPPVWW